MNGYLERGEAKSSITIEGLIEGEIFDFQQGSTDDQVAARSFGSMPMKARGANEADEQLRAGRHICIYLCGRVGRTQRAQMYALARDTR